MVTSADIARGSITNTVTASADPVDDDVVPTGGDDEVVPTEDPDTSLEVEKTVTSTPTNGDGYNVGDVITYMITVTNTGNVTYTNVVVDDDLTGDTWTIAVFYIDQDGNTVASSVKRTVPYGNAYRIPTPNVSGYTATRNAVEGTMPDYDVQVTVYFRRNRQRNTDPEDNTNTPQDNTVTINDYDTPLGLGNMSLNAGECFE